MEIEKQLKEIKAQQKVLKFMSLFGLKDDVNHVISPEDDKPVVTFEPKTKADYDRIMGLLKPEIWHNVYKESNGCTGFKPIKVTEIIEPDDHNTLLRSGIMIETQSTKYEHKLKVRFFIQWDRTRFIDVWVGCPLEWFKKYFFMEEIKDVYETETARQYNLRHADIMTKVPMLEGFIEVVKFWGGHYTFYSVNDKQTEYLNDILFVE